MENRDGERLTRRHFLKVGAGGALGLGGCALFVTRREPDLRLATTAGEFRLDRETVAAKGSVVVEVDGSSDKVLVILLPDGSVAAVSMACTHLGCDVEYSEPRNLIVCPCHGSEFGIMGDNLKGPATRPLQVHAVRIDGSEVVVNMG